MIFKRQILFFISFVFAQVAIAQGGSTIRASVDKKKILIGEPIQLTIETYLSPAAGKKFPVIDTIEHFEFIGEPIIDTADKNGSRSFKGIYKITSFDSGHWVIPSFTLSQDVKTDTIPIDVVFSEFDPNQDYHDIKDILEVKSLKKKTEWWWYVAGGVLLLALLLLYLRRRKKHEPVAVPKIMISPYEEAMKQLEQLQRNKPEAKQYHSVLTDIFRLYIFRKKGILSLQKTTDDLVIQLKSLNLAKEQFDKLSQSLRLSDFVKFAKYIPTSEDDKICFEEIKKSIIILEQSNSGSPSIGVS
ncbi:MAG: BatD family protein [Bacteroidota bacterium]|nr:BatD family protein [Bacteroidota bacterium]